MTLMFGHNAIQAQSTRRNDAQENRVQQTTQENRVQRTTQEKRVQQTAQQNRVQQTAQAERTQNERTLRNQSREQVRHQQTRPETRPVSISTGNNPRSTYGKPDSRIIATPPRNADSRINQYSSRRYYGGNHYHYAYPTGRVGFHTHYDTYVNHYNVLYYPSVNHVYWTRAMYRDYQRWYPNYSWTYRYGYRLKTISAFEAAYNMGEVAMVYGRVYATWHNRETDDYLLFFGGDYPHHRFTVVLPGNVARRFGWRPERFFLGEHVTVTGLITTFDGVPEIVVKNKRQVGLY